MHFARISSPYQSLNTLPHQKNPANTAPLYQQLCPRRVLEVRTREEKAGSCYTCPARLDHQQVSQERQGTIPSAVCKAERVTSSNKCEEMQKRTIPGTKARLFPSSRVRSESLSVPLSPHWCSKGSAASSV